LPLCQRCPKILDIIIQLIVKIMSDESDKWYIVKSSTGICEIVPNKKITEEQGGEILERWGPYDSRQDAIAHRVGLIRAGKCQPQ
jgi:hypothetical protein